MKKPGAAPTATGLGIFAMSDSNGSGAVPRPPPLLPMMPAAPPPAMPMMPAAPPASPAPAGGMPGAPAGDPPPHIEWLGESDFTGPAPPREWLVADMIPMHTVTLLGGDGGTGKSLLGLQLGHATTTGGPWLNCLPTPGGALYFSCEDDRDELHRRLDAIAAHTGQAACPPGLVIANMAGRDAVLTGVGKKDGVLRPTAVFGALEVRVAAVRPRLVVLDTLGRPVPR